MKYIEFDSDKDLDLILLGRVTIDFNPIDYYKTLAESEVFKKYVGVHLLILQWDYHGWERNAAFFPVCRMTGSVIMFWNIFGRKELTLPRSDAANTEKRSALRLQRFWMRIPAAF